jgi:hypothetical protein
MKETGKSDWFSAPVTRVSADCVGVTRAVFVQFRDAKIVRLVQPDLDFPVFVYVGADDLPVGLRITAPVSGEVLASLGSDRKVTYTFKPLPAEIFRPASRVVEQASRALERVT